jgi:hypothetical protein
MYFGAAGNDSTPYTLYKFTVSAGKELGKHLFADTLFILKEMYWILDDSFMLRNQLEDLDYYADILNASRKNRHYLPCSYFPSMSPAS